MSLNGEPLRVASNYPANKGSRQGLVKWFKTDGTHYVRHDLRCVLPNQIVFDLGDHGNWERTRAETHALWLTLSRMGIPYWGSMSGGKGTHTEVFGPRVFSLDPSWDWRREVADVILGMADMVLARATGNPFIRVEADPVTLNPNKDSRLVREFQRGKTGYGLKSLWVAGPAAFIPLPSTRELAYESLKGLDDPVPHAIPVCETLPLIAYKYHEARKMGLSCPQGPKCYPTGSDLSARCATCPGLSCSPH